jgi:hypothetical protein
MDSRVARFLRVLPLITALAAVACGDSPTRPSGTSTNTPSVTVPPAMQPTSGTQVRNVDQPVTLTVQNAVVTKTTVTTYTFEVASDAGFAAKVQTRDAVAEGSSGQTSVKLDMLPPGQDYYWHARATSGGTIGVFGPTSKFTVGPAVVLGAPAPVAPLNGAQTSNRVTLTVNNAARTGPAGTTTYRFEVAASAGFSPVVATGVVAQGAGQTSFLPVPDLGIEQTYFWRATAIDQANGVTGPSSAPQSFTTSMAIDLTKVVYLRGPNLSTWTETGKIIGVEQDGNAAAGGPMCIAFTDPGWPDVKWPYGGPDPNFGVFANQWYFAKIGGTWYAGPGEWIYRGAAVCKAGQGTRTIGPDSGFGEPFNSWVPKPGELVGNAISASARAYPNMFSVAERTNVVVQPWHDSSLQSVNLSQALFVR